MTPYQQFLVDSLRRGAGEVEGLVSYFPSEAAATELIPGKWTARRNISHLRDIELRYLERLEGVLSAGEYVPVPVQHRDAAEDESLAAMLDDYTVARARAINVFSGLDQRQWGRVFNHPTLWGDITVEWWAERFIQHTAEHVEALWMLRQNTRLTDAGRRRAQS